MVLILTRQQQTAFENIVGKEKIARNEYFLLFPQCFLLNQKIVSPFVKIFDITSLFAAEVEEPKIGIRGKGLSFLFGNLQILEIWSNLRLRYPNYTSHNPDFTNPKVDGFGKDSGKKIKY